MRAEKKNAKIKGDRRKQYIYDCNIEIDAIIIFKRKAKLSYFSSHQNAS